MPRYELDGEFWDITHQGNNLVIVTGTIGKGGREAVRKFVSPDKAEAQFVKLVGEKRAQGWTFVEHAHAVDDEDEQKLEELSEPTLEAAIRANPYDESAYSVYGDWLQTQGHPRGALIALQLAEENAPDDPKLRNATKKYVLEHKRVLTGGIEEHAALQGEHGPALVWRFGFIHRIEFDREMDMDCDTGELFTDVLRHPSGRFVTEITLCDEDVAASEPGIEAIGKHAPITVRELTLKTGGQLGGCDAVMRFPLVKLVIKARFGMITSDCLASLAKAPATLETFELRFGEEQELFDELAAVFRRPFPALRNLMLRGCLHAREVLPLLIATGSTHKLKRIDLALTELDVRCLDLLLDRKTFPELKTVRLTHDQVSHLALASLKRAGLKVEDVVRDRDDITDDGGDGYFDEIQE